MCVLAAVSSSAAGLIACAVVALALCVLFALDAGTGRDRFGRRRRLRRSDPDTRAPTPPARADAGPSSHGEQSDSMSLVAGTPAGVYPDDRMLAVPTQYSQRLRGAQYGPSTFELLAQRVDHTRRLAAAEQEVADRLALLPSERCFVERFVLVDGFRVPFLVLGEFGVFAVWAVSLRPQWSDTAHAFQLAGWLKERLPDYPGPVTPGICGAFDPGLRARYWYRNGFPGGSWVMGLDHLCPWMAHFGNDHGLGVEDLARFRALAGPHWSRPVKPVPAGVPNLDAGTPRHGE